MGRQRGETWAQQETTDFLRFFGEVRKQLDSGHWNQAIYKELAARMNSRGYHRTPHQLRTKAKVLRRQYRHMKEKGQPEQGDPIWSYYPLLDNILCDDRSTQPPPTTSSAPTANGEEHSEGMKGLLPPSGKPDYNQSPHNKLPDCRPQAPRRLSDAPLHASSPSRPLPRRQMRRPPAGIAFGLVKTRTKKCPSMRVFTKAFLLEHRKDMKRFQQLFQVQLDMQQQQREMLERQALKSQEEIRAAASLMREAILSHAEAVHRVGDAIQTYNTLLQRFLPEHSPQMEGDGNEA